MSDRDFVVVCFIVGLFLALIGYALGLDYATDHCKKFGGFSHDDVEYKCEVITHGK